MELSWGHVASMRILQSITQGVTACFTAVVGAAELAVSLTSDLSLPNFAARLVRIVARCRLGGAADRDVPVLAHELNEIWKPMHSSGQVALASWVAAPQLRPRQIATCCSSSTMTLK
jgi:hypothetical protein